MGGLTMNENIDLTEILKVKIEEWDGKFYYEKREEEL